MQIDNDNDDAAANAFGMQVSMFIMQKLIHIFLRRLWPCKD